MSNDQDCLPASRVSLPGPSQGPRREMGNRNQPQCPVWICLCLQLWDWGQLWPWSQLSASGECLVGFSQMWHHSTSGSSSIPRLAQTSWSPVLSQYSSRVRQLGSARYPRSSGSWASKGSTSATCTITDQEPSGEFGGVESHVSQQDTWKNSVECLNSWLIKYTFYLKLRTAKRSRNVQSSWFEKSRQAKLLKVFEL